MSYPGGWEASPKRGIRSRRAASWRASPPVYHLGPIHVGHHHIREDQVDFVRMLSEAFNSPFSTVRPENAVAVMLEAGRHYPPHRVVIINDHHSFGTMKWHGAR